MVCEYVSKETGNRMSEVEFDAFLFDTMTKIENNKDANSEGLSMFTAMDQGIMFSLDQHNDTIKKVEKIQSEIGLVLNSTSEVEILDGEDPDINKKLHDVSGYMGVTSFITEFGNPKKGIDHPIVTGFNENSWEAKKRAELGLTIKSTTEIDRIIQETKDSWKQLQKIGDAVHAIYESVFKGTTPPTSTELTDELYQSTVRQAIAFKDSLIRRFGEGDPSKVAFYPEISIASKKLDRDLEELLSEKDGTHSIAGTIDLLVVDSKGQTHIFDYKTSRKELDPTTWDETSNRRTPPDKWSTTKKLSVQNQLAAYNAMLEQWGIRNSSCEVVPILLDLEYTDEYKSKISGIKDIRQQESSVVPKTSNGDIYQNWKTLLPASVQTTAQAVIDLSEKHQKLIPTNRITSVQVQQFEADLEYYKKHVKNVSSEDPKYPEYKFYFVKYETNGKREYCKNEEDLNKKLENYVAYVKEKKSNELYALASTIRRALSGEVSLDDFVHDYNIANRNFLQTQFNRYIVEGWDLVSDDNLIGSGIFIFQTAGRSEVVVISNEPLSTKFNLGKGSSLLGRFVEDQYIDSKEILAANNGNIDAMKALIYIADNPELFKDCKITQLVTLNPWRGQRTYIHNSQWVLNYNRLVETTKDDSFKPIDRSSLFWDDVPSLLSIVDSNLRAAETPSELSGFSLEGQISADGNVLQFTEEYVEKALDKMRKDYPFLVNAENEMIGDQNVWMAYNYLNQTLLSLKGLHVYNELEPGQWMSAGVKAGLMVSSSGYSASTNFRVFDDVMQQFALEVRLAVEKQGRPVISTLTKFYESKGRPKIVGGERDYFLNWFRKTPKGEIDPSFSLKDPNDPDFDGNQYEREALDTWLKTMAELRFRPLAKSDEDFETLVEQTKANGMYYEVPLTEGRFSSQVKGVGLIQAVKNKWKEASELTMDVFAGETKEKENWRKENPYELYNKFNKDSRQRAALIEEHGIGFFETDLEEVINQALVAYNKSRLSRKFIPIIDGMRVALRCNAAYGGAKMKETLASFDKLVKSKFYGESIIDESLQPIARWVQAIKAGFSKLALGFNFRSFFRELFQGTWMGLSRSGVELLPGVDINTYTKGALHVITNAHKNFSNVSLLQQMNAQYGMANYSMAQIARQRKKNWYGIRNFRSDTMFLTSSAPDFQHRMSILVAKMMGDGCWEAHSLDKDGFLKYDFYQDNRFKIYLAGDTSNKEYLIQKANYLERIKELNKAGIKKDDGSNYVEGDPLPMAYLPKEVQAIKNFADLLYGHYDDESKSLVTDMLLGSLFLQYKTYVTSRVEQWTMTPGIYNTQLLVQATDPISGEKLYKVHTGAVDESGIPIIDIKAESKIENFDELMKTGNIEACMEWKGIPMEGMGRSYVKFIKDILTWNWADFKEKWDNPVERDNILIGLHDCLLMMLMMMLVTALFGVMLKGEWTTDTREVAKAARDAGWATSFSYNIAYGSFQDFPFWQTLNSMFGDFNPSMVTSAKRLVENTGNVILGKKSIFQAVTNTVGAAGDLKGLANRLASATKDI